MPSISVKRPVFTYLGNTKAPLGHYEHATRLISWELRSLLAFISIKDGHQYEGQRLDGDIFRLNCIHPRSRTPAILSARARLLISTAREHEFYIYKGRSTSRRSPASARLINGSGSGMARSILKLGQIHRHPSHRPSPPAPFIRAYANQLKEHKIPEEKFVTFLNHSATR